MWQDEECHIVWACSALVFERHHQVDGVCLFALLLFLYLLLLALLFLHVDGV